MTVFKKTHLSIPPSRPLAVAAGEGFLRGVVAWRGPSGRSEEHPWASSVGDSRTHSAKTTRERK